MSEIWKDIKDWEGLYQISSEGRVRRILNDGKFNIKRNTPNKKRGGYLHTRLSDQKNRRTKTWFIHRIVAETFLNESRKKGLNVHHIDSNRTNNKVSNLQWVTSRENSHKIKTKKKTSKHIGVCWHILNNKWVAYIFFNKKLHHLGYFKEEDKAAIAYKKKLRELCL